MEAMFVPVRDAIRTPRTASRSTRATARARTSHRAKWTSARSPHPLVESPGAIARSGLSGQLTVGRPVVGRVRHDGRWALLVVSVLTGALLVASDGAAQPVVQSDSERPSHSALGCPGGTMGPTLDPIAGDRVGRAELECLPSGRHLGAVFDVWFNRVTSQQIGVGGGIAFFDPLRLSAHGRSWRQTRFHLNGVDITDPARPGEPLFELPYSAWDGLEYQSLWTARPGVNMDFHAESPDAWRLRGATGWDIGGGTWIPSGLFDREPATEYGATSERRRLRPVAELFAERAWHHGQTGRVRLLGSFVDHERRYPTLLSNDGRNEVDRSRRGTFALRHDFESEGGTDRFSTTVFGQTNDRSHAGAQYRWESPLTLDTTSRAWGAHFGWARPQSDFAMVVGVTARRDDERSRRDTPFVRDLESAWMHLARPREAEELSRWRLDTTASWTWAGWQLRVRGAYARVGIAVQPQPLKGVSYLRGPDRGQSAAHSLELASAFRHDLESRETRVDVERDFRLRAATLTVMTALDHSAVDAGGGRGLAHWSPALGAALRAPCGGVECFALVRREPVALTRDVSEFLSPHGSSTTHVWNDDGDLLPEPGEQGLLLARHGGTFRAKGDHLARPSSNHFAFGVQTSERGTFRAAVSGVGRWLFRPYTVRLFDPSVYSAVEALTAEGQPVTAYTLDLSRAGQDTYVLVNDPDASRYLGFEAQVHTQTAQRWFLHLSASGYQFLTNSPFGSFADRNDPGAIHEITANPNGRVNGRGRADSDRAYASTLLVGRELTRDLWLSAATRYLDGQPFARIDVVESLAQGPTAVMATPRGTPGPRHTFHMTTDVRLAYLWRAPGRNTLSLVLDVFNLLGSGTEIAEDPRAGSETYRRALEMIPGRALLVALEWRKRSAHRGQPD